MNMLELNRKPNIWNPPVVDAMGLAIDIRDDINARQCNQFLYIFQTVPYVDSIYIRYDSNREPKEIRRFAFHEGYNWDPDDEEYFNDHCVREEMCSYNGSAIETVYNYFQMIRPEWHVQRYYNKGLRLLDHIYNCMKQNTAKEILYKAGLDELAAHIDDLDELNLMAGKPSDIYDGVSMRVLKSLNCPYGSILLAEKSRREFVRELNIKFPDIFKSKLNDAMCRYITTLMKGDLTVGETGRLFQSRRSDLAQIWTMSFFDIFMARDLQKREMDELCKVYESIDPIYGTYIRHIEEPVDDFNLKQLGFYLLSGREEYDKAIRRSNRKRVYEWMERGDEYIVRYPQTINDFCREALYMENCLLTYIEAVIENDTTILFMRKADDINTPFITIEIYDGQLMQAYHRFNKDCTDEEANWIRGYCTRHGIGLEKFSFNADVDELY